MDVNVPAADVQSTLADAPTMVSEACGVSAALVTSGPNCSPGKSAGTKVDSRSPTRDSDVSRKYSPPQVTFRSSAGSHSNWARIDPDFSRPISRFCTTLSMNTATPASEPGVSLSTPVPRMEKYVSCRVTCVKTKLGTESSRSFKLT